MGWKINIRHMSSISTVVLAAFMLLAGGCGGGDSSENQAAALLGSTKLVALRGIPGEPGLKELVTASADDGQIEVAKLDQAYSFEVSPDQKTVAYVADDGIYIIGINGERKTRISVLTPKFDLNTDQERLVGRVMAWSPDGSQIAFVCGGDLYVTAAKAGQKERLVAKRTPDNLITKEGAPALAPRIEGITSPNWLDNQTLIYQDFFSKFDGQWSFYYRIMRVDTEGAGKEVIVANGQEPLLSPDGKRILYHENNDLGGWVKIANATGSGVRVLNTLQDADRQGMTYSWSHDSEYVLFDGFAVNIGTGKSTVYSGTIGLPDEGIVRTKSTQLPTFSPDGKYIMFSTSAIPKLVKFEGKTFTYESGQALKHFEGLDHIYWIKG